jgi:hypothetical protein
VRIDLPPGTVTVLFTDVEGSTRLLHELGEAGYAAALRELRERSFQATPTAFLETATSPFSRWLAVWSSQYGWSAPVLRARFSHPRDPYHDTRQPMDYGAALLSERMRESCAE